MTFGLRNASQTFQRFINHVLGDLDFVFVYIDDILVASSSQEEHEEHLRVVFERLKKFKLRLNVEKCEFGKTEITFLGYLINQEGCHPTKDRVQAITQFSKPQTVVELRRFLGMINFYRRNIPRATEVQAPLNAYLTDVKKNDKREIAWTPEAEAAFEKAKTGLINATLLSHPCMDAKMRVVTDASDTSMGAALEQLIDGSWKSLAFFSKKFNVAQCVYSAYDRELTAIYEAIKFFKHFLEARDFCIVTDQKPLTYAFLQKAEKASPRQQRQLSFTSQFTTRIEHLPGSQNVVADPLSRVDAIELPRYLVDLIRLPVDFDLLELSKLQDEDPELKQLRESPDCSLKFKCIEWGSDHNRVFCDLTGEALRPYIPKPLRKRVFDLFHGPAHGSAKVMDQVIRKRYVWPNMHRDIKTWCKLCIDCQKSKISRHVKLIPADFVAPDTRFHHVHMEIVGPLRDCNGYRYCLTLIDRFLRWAEAIPLKGMPYTGKVFCCTGYNVFN